MKVSIEVELEPFTTPNYVLAKSAPKMRQEGVNDKAKFHLSELDAMTLDRLCNEFRDDVFRKAGKAQPPRCA